MTQRKAAKLDQELIDLLESNANYAEQTGYRFTASIHAASHYRSAVEHYNRAIEMHREACRRSSFALDAINGTRRARMLYLRKAAEAEAEKHNVSILVILSMVFSEMGRIALGMM